MLKIRLQRRGKRNYATYRVVVADRRAPIKGRFVADLGHYNPHSEVFSVDAEKIQSWIGKGAQPSPTVHNLLVTNNILKGDKVTSWTPKKKEADEAEATAEEAPQKDAEQAETKEDAGEPEEKPETEATDTKEDAA